MMSKNKQQSPNLRMPVESYKNLFAHRFVYMHIHYYRCFVPFMYTVYEANY